MKRLVGNREKRTLEHFLFIPRATSPSSLSLKIIPFRHGKKQVKPTLPLLHEKTRMEEDSEYILKAAAADANATAAAASHVRRRLGLVTNPSPQCTFMTGG